MESFAESVNHPATNTDINLGLVAGELSGDLLGGSLLAALRDRGVGFLAEGVAGPAMRAEGCDPLFDVSELAVMGLTEVVSHLPRLLKTRRALRRHFLANRPDVFIGIDSPDFNLGLEAKLRAKGIATVQYVSPQLWAWRGGRVKKIARSADLVLCLLPFEPDLYRAHDVAAEFVGHPMADQIDGDRDATEARRQLGLATDGELVALLPGSRRSEVTRLAADFVAAAAWLHERRPGIRFVTPLAAEHLRPIFEAAHRFVAPRLEIELVQGRAQDVIAAADAVLLASGTAALETALIGRPMVVAYRLAPTTRLMLRWPGLLRTNHFALPNLVAGEVLVPEIMQDDISAEALGSALMRDLEDQDRRRWLKGQFADIRRTLQRNAAGRAADAILALLAERDRGVANQ